MGGTVRGCVLDTMPGVYDILREMVDQATEPATFLSLSANGFQLLLRHYLACVEEEDLRSLRFRLTSLHRSFISPWDDSEPLFYSDSTEAVFRVSLETDVALLTLGALKPGEPVPFYYGYPVYVDASGMLSPLFFTEVEIVHRESGEFALRPANPQELHFNHHFLSSLHTGYEEIRDAQDLLEGTFGSFGARLKAAAAYVGELPADLLDGPRLDAMPEAGSKDVWRRRPIVFRSEHSNYTVHLRRELSALAEYDKLAGKAHGTALGPLLAPQSSMASASQDSVPAGVVLCVRPLNGNQYRALQRALRDRLTVVTGPPGTGKSQVVVNLLANAVLSGKSVLFASKNNKAVDVVKAWLAEVMGEEEDWSLRVGNKERMDILKQDLTARLESVKPSEASDLTTTALDRLSTLVQMRTSVYERVKRTRLALTELGAAEMACACSEVHVPERWRTAFRDAPGVVFDVSRLNELDRDTGALARSKNLGLRLWFLRLFLGPRLVARYARAYAELCGAMPELVRDDLLSELNDALDWTPFLGVTAKLRQLHGWNEAGARVRDANVLLSQADDSLSLSQDLDNIDREIVIVSRRVLQTLWTNRVAGEKDLARLLVRRYFELAETIRHTKGHAAWLKVKDDLVRTCRRLFDRFPVWIATNLSVRRALPLEASLFDLAIIDEASQCDIASALPILYRARRAVVIGDPHQLRHVSTLTAQQETAIAERLGTVDIMADWSYREKSLYDVAAASILTSLERPIELTEHYRSHPDIVDFSNREFYHNLVPRTDLTSIRKRTGGLRLGVYWHEVIGAADDADKSASNENEAKAITKQIGDWHRAGQLKQDGLSVGVVTPFRKQMELVERLLSMQPWFKHVGCGVRVGTAHVFQGDEADIMLYSPVVAEGMLPRLTRWVAHNGELLNVALTRARGVLHVFGNSSACRAAGGFLSAFAAHVLDGRGSSSPHLSPGSAEGLVASMLERLGLWYHLHYVEGQDELDFLVVSQLGERYDVEVDGRQHLTEEHILHDEVRDKRMTDAGYRVVRIPARRVYTDPEGVEARLAKLV